MSEWLKYKYIIAAYSNYLLSLSSKIYNMKDKVINLFDNGNSNKEIALLLGCAESTVSYHINNRNKKSRVLPSATIKEIKEFYSTHTAEETKVKFKVGLTTIKKYGLPKRVTPTEEDKKIYSNYKKWSF